MCVCVCVCVPVCVPRIHARNAPPTADARSGVVPVGPARLSQRREEDGDRRQPAERRSPTAKVLTRAAAKLQRLVGDTAGGGRPAGTSVTTAASTAAASAEGRPRTGSGERRSGSKAGAVQRDSERHHVAHKAGAGQRHHGADTYVHSSSTLHTHSRGGNAQSARGLSHRLAADTSVTTSCRPWSSVYPAQSCRGRRLSDVSDDVAPRTLSARAFRERILSEYSVADSPGAQGLFFGRAAEPSIALVRERERRASCGNGVGNDVARAAVKRAALSQAQRARQGVPGTEHVALWRVAAGFVFRTGVVVISAGAVLGVIAMYIYIYQALQRSMAL